MIIRLNVPLDDEVRQSFPPQSGSVPSVVGKDFETAQSTLENAGFQVNTVWVYDDNVATGNVVGQTPSSAAPGATITIRVSSGPRPSA